MDMNGRMDKRGEGRWREREGGREGGGGRPLTHKHTHTQMLKC